jgi:hypothetical protein
MASREKTKRVLLKTSVHDGHGAAIALDHALRTPVLRHALNETYHIIADGE